MNKYMFIPLLLGVVLMISCGGQGRSGYTGHEQVYVDSASMITPTYAKGFNVTYGSDVTLLDINDPENLESEQFHFALVNKDFEGRIPEGYTRLNVPIESAICMTSLQLSNFLKLDIPEKVVGITSTRHLHNEKMNQQLKSGKTHKIGIEGNFDNEVIMSINPDVIFISPFKRGGYDAIRNVDIPMVPHLGYKELTPLGQAEWIKVIGLLTGNAAKANSIFGEIEARYNGLKAMVDTVSERPTVFSGEMRGGNWYAVGGKSFLAQMFRDAGGDYFLKDNKESGGVTLDYETVYTNAAHADYWRIVNSFEGDYGYNVLKEQDNRYTDFDAWRNKGVIYCNMKEVPFYERMPVEPEEVLADFIHIFHPGILPNHQPSYYHLLK
ncbi:MAG: ABC transporter substrate-binding protein [Muribaculaceae bacterium]|nr:ABC transporter substrate-binding protein [Muribaculaceae bacterium]